MKNVLNNVGIKQKLVQYANYLWCSCIRVNPYRLTLKTNFAPMLNVVSANTMTVH
jgi:hypothetical protein